MDRRRQPLSRCTGQIQRPVVGQRTEGGLSIRQLIWPSSRTASATPTSNQRSYRRQLSRKGKGERACVCQHTYPSDRTSSRLSAMSGCLDCHVDPSARPLPLISTRRSRPLWCQVLGGLLLRPGLWPVLAGVNVVPARGPRRGPGRGVRGRSSLRYPGRAAVPQPEIGRLIQRSVLRCLPPPRTADRVSRLSRRTSTEPMRGRWRPLLRATRSDRARRGVSLRRKEK